MTEASTGPAATGSAPAWASPGSAAEQPRRPVDAVPSSSGSTTSGSRGPDAAGVPGPVRPPLPPVPVALGPMTVPDLLDGSFEIIRRRPRDVLLLAAVLVLPVELLTVLLFRDVLGTEGLGAIGDPSDLFGTETTEPVGTDVVLASTVGSALALALLAGALAVLVDGWYRGEDVTPRQAVVAALRRSWGLVAGVLVVKALEGVGLLAVGLGAYYAMAVCHVVSPAVTVERLGPLAAVGRSFRLTRHRLGPALLVPGLVAVVGLVVGSGLQAAPELAVIVTPDDWHWLVRSAGQLLSQLVVVPFTAGVAVLFHLDLRIRAEAHDIDLRTRALVAG